MRALLVSGLLAAALTTSGGAQQRSATFARWDPPAVGELTWGSASQFRRAPTAGGGRDYRYEGLMIGGLALGALGAWVGSQLRDACPTEPGVGCDSESVGNAVTLGLVGAAIGGGLGYLVGRLSSKAEPVAERTDRVPQ
jgi:hypothetical protein